MKIRNKRTGEIIEIITKEDVFNSLAELNDEWEDYYEEPKKYWAVSSIGEVFDVSETARASAVENASKIGNYFVTEKEAKLAVKKLTAWKRLKDKGFRFTYWDIRSGSRLDNRCEGEFVMFSECPEDIEKEDLDLLFGVEK